ncbi:MAG TPA: hypothetical protein VMG10_21880 [Gemmataceae bacterium]|nr:hypothetical protein [Gemmataceae bacterium]
MWRLLVLGIVAVLALFLAIELTWTGLVASEAWRDFVAWFSLFLTTLGLGYTVYQVTLIESSARAAKKAAEGARLESRRRLFQLTAASIHQLINAVSDDLERREWGKAMIRLNNLADQAAQIGGSDMEWVELVHGLREAAADCLALESQRRGRPTHAKWLNLLTDLRTRLDAFFGPLRTD